VSKKRGPEDLALQIQAVTKERGPEDLALHLQVVIKEMVVKIITERQINAVVMSILRLKKRSRKFNLEKISN